MFCSPSMKECYIPGSVKVLSGDDVSAASDHKPVIASFAVWAK